MPDTDRHERISSLINEALDLPPHQRNAFLESACRGDSRLRREIESLLSQVTPPLASPNSVGPPNFTDVFAQVANRLAAQEQTPRAHPERIGAYRILDLLGEGGMGAVYRAEQSEPVARQVALKVIHTSLRSPTMLERFHAERNALARLAHPNVAVLHEAGTTEDGFPFFAMEHVVGGEALDRYCDRLRLSVEDRLELFLQICRGVQHAHQKGILHRDLKPSNVLVAPDQGGGHVKIIDFGLAKSFSEIPLSDLTQLTAGRPIGTPAYMSPEARRGSQDLDTRTDVFSLGVLLYELLTGSRPLTGSSRSLSATTRPLRDEEMRLPSAQILEADDEILACRRTTRSELRRALLGELDWILLRALAGDRDERYGSASELAADIERRLRHEPVSVGPPALMYRLRKFARRHRVGVSMAAGALALAAIVAGVLGHTRRQADRRTRLNSELNREVERIEWLQRVAHQLPLGTGSGGDREVLAAMDRIRAKLDFDAAGLASYALGRGELALGRPETARRHLQAALDAGYQAPETYLALGWALSELYDRKLDAIRRIEDPDLRRFQEQAADAQLRRPALEALGKSEGSGWIAPELLEATLALREGDLDRAIDRGRRASKRLGWLYEARFVVARALIRKAEDTREIQGKLDLADGFYGEAARELEEALEVGRSDPKGHRLLCAVLGGRLDFIVRYSRPGFDPLLETTLRRCDLARQLSPEMLEPALVQGRGLLGLAQIQLWDRGEDPYPAVRRAEELLTEATASSEGEAPPLDKPEKTAEALRILGVAFHTYGTYLYRTGEDPQETFETSENYLKRASELAPRSAETFAKLAELFAQRASWQTPRGIDARPSLDAAIEAGQRATSLRPEMYSAHHALGIALTLRAVHDFERGIPPDEDIRQAEATYGTAMTMEPNSVTVPANLSELKILQAKVLRRRGEDTEAILLETLELVEHRQPSTPEDGFVLFRKGKVHTELAWNSLHRGDDPRGDLAEARKAFEGGLADLPRIAGAWMDLAGADLVEARWELSQGSSPKRATEAVIRSARRGLELDSSRPDGHSLIGLAYLVRAAAADGSAAETARRRARQEIQEAIEKGPTTVAYRIAFARLAFMSAQEAGLSRRELPALLKKGLDYAMEAEGLDPSEPEATLLRGALLALDPATRAAGEALMARAYARNGRLILDWRTPIAPASDDG